MRTRIPQTHIFADALRIFAAVLLAFMPVLTLNATESPKKSSGKHKKEQTFTVVIDAGHGGHDHGAIDNGEREKDINLGVAKKFAAKVKKKLKNVNVVMTRDDDTFISLQERANIANRNKGNLFVSIHTNSVDKKNPNRKTVSGTSVYALGPQKDANNLKVAQRENSVIELEDNYHQKYSGFDPSKDESYIIFEMAQKKTLGQSLKFADKAQKELVSTAGRKDRGVKQAGFWVLWATAMPSVLVELDFICNPDEASFLGSAQGQDKLADALTNALASYIDAVRDSGPGTPLMAGDKSSKDKDERDEPDLLSQTVDDYDGINTLTNNSTKSKKRVHVAQTGNKNNTTSRRRRSEASKQKSDSRSLETESISLKSEKDYLAIKEEASSEIDSNKANDDSTDKQTRTSKNKKKKDKKNNKDNKDKKKDKKKESKSAGKSSGTKNKKRTANPNQKTFVVKKADNPVPKGSGKLKARNKTQEAEGASGQAGNNEGFSGMEYTIVLLSSPVELKTNDPAFCGLTIFSKMTYLSCQSKYW